MVCFGRASIHAGAKTMRQVRVPVCTLGLLILGLAATVTSAAAQNQGPCRQIRLACEGAGFTQGAAREGIGLQVHCITPIMQTRAQPPTARRPLPTVNPQLVAECQASNPSFGQPRTPQSEARAQPPSLQPPDFVYPNGNPPPAYGAPGAMAPIQEDVRRHLPRFMAAGESNPLGARALYLGQTLYRIHGTNQPSTIGTFVSSSCIRLTNEDIMDLYGRVQVGTRVVVLPSTPPKTAQTNPGEPAAVSTPLALPPGRVQ
jgi:hypothetical protein